MGFSLFLLLNSLFKLNNLFFLDSVFSYVKMGEQGRSWAKSQFLCCTSNLANTYWPLGFTMFPSRVVDSGFLERCLERDSEEAQQVFPLTGCVCHREGSREWER